MNLIVKNLHDASIKIPHLSLNHKQLSRVIQVLVRLIYLPALFISMFHADLAGYLLVLFIAFVFEVFAIQHITNILSHALNVNVTKPTHQDDLHKINDYFQPLPDDWHDKIKHAVASNEFHCGNCGRQRSGYSITHYPQNNKCEQCK